MQLYAGLLQYLVGDAIDDLLLKSKFVRVADRVEPVQLLDTLR